MKGHVTVYERKDGRDNVIFSQDNMVVEGAKYAIVDMLSVNLPHSSVSSSANMAVSSYTIGAFTLGGPTLNFEKHDSRLALKLDHASGINYLGASGDLLSLVSSVDNRLMNEYGGVGKETRSQPRYDSTIETYYGSQFDVDIEDDISIGSSLLSQEVVANVGQAYATLKVDTSLVFGRDYKFRVEGESNRPFELAYVFKDRQGGAPQYFNTDTGKFQVGEYYSELEFENGVASLDLNLDYTEGEKCGTMSVYIIAPRRNLYEKGYFTLDSVSVSTLSYILMSPELSNPLNWVSNSDFDNFKYTNLEKGIATYDSWVKSDSFNDNLPTSSIGYVYIDEDYDGVTIQASSLTGSGSARLTQKLTANERAIESIHAQGYPYNGFAVLNLDVFSQTTDALGLTVELKDITTGEFYSFSSDGYSSARWGSNVPLVLGSNVKDWAAYSAIVKLEDRVSHTFELTLKGNGTGSAFAKYSVRNVEFGNLNGWSFGNGDISLVEKEEGDGVYLTSTQTDLEGEDYSGLTYIGQKFIGIDPIKAYTLVVDAEPIGVSSHIGIAITHRDFYNLGDSERLNAINVAGILDLTAGHASAKQIRKGYAEYLNPYKSASSVPDPYLTNVNDDAYRNSNQAVALDASFQSSLERLFVPLSPGTHTVSSRTTNTSVDENYYFGLRVRHNDQSRLDYFYNFSTKKWVALSSGDTPYKTDSNFRTSLENTNFTFSMLDSDLKPSYKIDGKYVVTLDLVNDNNSLTFDESLYVHELAITDSPFEGVSSDWFNGGELARTSYYLGSGIWSGVTDIAKPNLSASTVPVGTILNYEIVEGEQLTIPLYKFVDASASFQSTYDVHIFPLSGEGLRLKKVALADYSFQGFEGNVDISNLDQGTSERKYSRVPFLEGGWHFHTLNYNTNDGSLPTLRFNSLSGTPVIEYLKESATPLAGMAATTSKIGDLNLPSKTIKTSFDYVQDGAGNSNIKYALLYKNDITGVEYIWDWTDTKWKLYNYGVLEGASLDGVASVVDFPANASNTDIFTNFLSENVTLPAELNSEDKLTFIIYFDQSGNGAYAAVTNFRYYGVTTTVEASSLFPDFPNPEDTTVQPITDGPGRLGHFLNSMEYQYNSPNYEESVYDGCFAEGSGTTVFSSGSYVSAYGNLNQYGVITPNGFILEQKINDRASQSVDDASAGMVVSAVGSVSSTRQIKYAISLTRDEWFLINEYYGGLGAVGLWTYNYTETSKKFGSNEGLGGPPFITSGSPTSLATSAGAGSGTTRNDASVGPEFLNGYAMRVDSDTKSALSLFHTGFGSPPGRVNPNGWCVSGDDYTLTLEYKAVGDNLELRSDNFPAQPLSGDGIWHRKEVSFTASSNGFNKAGVVLRRASDTSDIVEPYILVGSALLYDDTNTSAVASYDFTSDSDMDNFSTKWYRPNKVKQFRRVWDGDFYVTSLYNSSVLAEKEPIYRLFSKKVFFPGGLQIDPSSDYLTIIWTVDF